MPSFIRGLQYAANINVLVIITLAIVEYVYVKNQFSQLGQNFLAVQNSFSLISQLQQSAYHVRSLVFHAESELVLSDAWLNLTSSDLKASLN